MSLWKVRINGNLTILTAGFHATENGVIWVGDATITGGSVTGKRYIIENGGIIYGKALETLPGDVAGTYNALPGFTLASGVLTGGKFLSSAAADYQDVVIGRSANTGFAPYVEGRISVQLNGQNSFGFSEEGLYLHTNAGILFGQGFAFQQAWTSGLRYDGAAGTIALCREDQKQTFRIYALYNGANYERMAFNNPSTGTMEIAAETGGTGTDNIDLKLTPAGTGKVQVAGGFNVDGAATFAAGTITASKPITITQTWNDVTVPFVGLDFNLTDTLSHAASAPVLFRINGSTKFAVRKDGAVITKPPASASPGVNGDVLVEATSDTLLTTKFKGSDGNIRSAGMQMGGPLTGVVTVSTSAPSGGNDGDIWYQYT
jgi:hypothetical protein